AARRYPTDIVYHPFVSSRLSGLPVEGTAGSKPEDQPPAALPRRCQDHVACRLATLPQPRLPAEPADGIAVTPVTLSTLTPPCGRRLGVARPSPAEPVMERANQADTQHMACLGPSSSLIQPGGGPARHDICDSWAARRFVSAAKHITMIGLCKFHAASVLLM
ncbi:MAG TPA: hypothetical protein VHL09_02595, partial [Dehalococcoidia bacterium]|nr:hypothetical protein [Dehalococcoidia bacterium]